VKFMMEAKIRSRVRYVSDIVAIPIVVMRAVCIETRGFFSLWALTT